jgi:hypothetical protein
VNVVSEIWHRALASQPAPSSAVIAATAVVAALLVLTPPVWPRSRHLVTIAHEGSHGLAALLTGRRLSGIRLHSDSSGLTLSSGKPTGLGMIVTVAVGYIGPGLIGLGAAALLGAGHAVGLLWALLVLLALMLVQIRNLFGLWSVLATGLVVFAVSWWLPEQAQSAFAYLAAWFLLMAAPRPVCELYVGRRRGQERNSDADQLATLTVLPAFIWLVVFLGITVGTLVAGARWMIPLA